MHTRKATCGSESFWSDRGFLGAKRALRSIGRPRVATRLTDERRPCVATQSAAGSQVACREKAGGCELPRSGGSPSRVYVCWQAGEQTPQKEQQSWTAARIPLGHASIVL